MMKPERRLKGLQHSLLLDRHQSVSLRLSWAASTTCNPSSRGSDPLRPLWAPGSHVPPPSPANTRIIKNNKSCFSWKRDREGATSYWFPSLLFCWGVVSFGFWVFLFFVFYMFACLEWGCLLWEVEGVRIGDQTRDPALTKQAVYHSAKSPVLNFTLEHHLWHGLWKIQELSWDTQVGSSGEWMNWMYLTGMSVS